METYWSQLLGIVPLEVDNFSPGIMPHPIQSYGNIVRIGHRPEVKNAIR